MNKLKVTSKVYFKQGRRSRKQMCLGEKPKAPPGRIPRVAKLMALAIRFDNYIASGVVEDYAELARLGHVTRARITQIMNLLNLAPDIQETILHLPRVESGRDTVTERDLRPIVLQEDWRQQRRMWNALAPKEGS
ncbi:hypothetical protein Pla110_23660 [Polystyrenella longa]|uniref:Uncharacterized protein n=1 Tax=Polystyrenella longa TaxID=2528007 RepID=A0A518CN33_9PLAN|nr:hypothetical protein [Polystyrenella longa]QDU80635.1 hypothetical protein Pla110_23660 [Polystyrenella longa]